MNLKKITSIALISTLAYICMLFIKYPIDFLTFDVKDVVIALGGFIFGPIACAIIAFLVAFLELITISTTGIVGFFMNFISTIFYTLPIVIIYKKNRTKKGLILGIILGTISMSIIMIIFNILISPAFLGWPLEEVLALLPTFITPFNIGKGIVNGILIVFLAVPLKNALNKANLI